MTPGKGESASPEDESTYWLFNECRMVNSETIYTQTIKADSMGCICIFVYTHIMIIKRLSMRVGVHVRNWREEREGEVV